jgi:hypothetical protein
MKGKCFEIGTIQAFLDGETTPDVSLRLTSHIAACDPCARLVSVAEEESSIVFSTLGRELDTLVPTQRLWSRINETIEIEKGRTPVWRQVLAYITVSLANPSITAAASILLVLGVFAIMIGTGDDTGTLLSDRFQKVAPTTSSQTETVDIATTGHDAAIPSTAGPSVAISEHSERELRALATQVNARSTQREIIPQRAVYNPDAYLPGEESYVKTITDLKENVDSQKDAVLTPSTRVSFERDMAVVNDSIKRMREVVKKNPRNQAARQVLYASYQDKIDLLSSVAQREELMASLR